MSLPPMRFKTFSWPKNPAKLHISSERQVKEVFLPFLQSSFQDLGSKRRIVSGEGVFLGPHAADAFQSLSGLLSQGGSGTLSLPALPPLSASLVRLDLLADPLPNSVRYSFEFWEDPAAPSDSASNASLRSVPVPAGGNVWATANQYGCSYQQVIDKNPHIQWPNFFPADDWLVIP